MDYNLDSDFPLFYPLYFERIAEDTLYIRDGAMLPYDYLKFNDKIRKIVIENKFDYDDDTASHFYINDLESFEVQSLQSPFCTINGVLYLDLDKANRGFVAEQITSNFEQKQGLALIAFPSGYNEESFKIPYGVVAIADSAFYGCKLKEISIPDTVNHIGYGTFNNVPLLEYLRVPNRIIPLFDHHITHNNKMVILSNNDEELVEEVREYWENELLRASFCKVSPYTDAIMMLEYDENMVNEVNNTIVNHKPIIDDTMNYYETRYNSSEIKIVGVGGGAGKMLNCIYNKGAENVSFAVCDTDIIALNQMDIPLKIKSKEKMIPVSWYDNTVGDWATGTTIPYVHHKLFHSAKMAIIVIALGGETGTVLGSDIARIAHEKGVFTIGIVTIPFSFEHKRKYQRAVDTLETIREKVDALLVIDNECLIDESERSTITVDEAFQKTNDVLSDIIETLIEPTGANGRAVDKYELEVKLKSMTPRRGLDVVICNG